MPNERNSQSHSLALLLVEQVCRLPRAWLSHREPPALELYEFIAPPPLPVLLKSCLIHHLLCELTSSGEMAVHLLFREESCCFAGIAPQSQRGLHARQVGEGGGMAVAFLGALAAPRWIAMFEIVYYETHAIQ
jgi:hypothetical protein